MGFLAPTLLFLGAAIAVPIVLHLFQRHQGPRVVFPALRYLRRAEKESARQIRLRQLLLLLVRAAALILIAMAAARPFLRSGGSQHQPTAVVIVLDNSLSTGAVAGDRRVLDVLKDRALETLEAAGADDRIWLIRAGAPWEPALSGESFTLAERVRETEPTAAAADLAAALDHARGVLAAGAEGRVTEIHLLSDFQVTNFATGGVLLEDGPSVLAWSPEEAAPPNGRVAAVEIEGGLAPIAGERAVLAATLAGETGEDSLAARLAVDGRVVAAARVPPGATALLSVPEHATGLMTGWVETDPDALRADDRRYFAVHVRPPPRAALTAPQEFVGQALDVLAGAGRLSRVDAAVADVVIAPAAAGLETLQPGQSVVVLAPESPVQLPAVNRRLGAAALPWRLAPGASEGEARLDVEPGRDPLSEPLSRVRLSTVYELVPEGDPAVGDTVLLGLRDGGPWAVRGERRAGGRFVIIASPFTDSASTLPTSPAMLPLLERILAAWTATVPARLEIEPGERPVLPADTRAILRPDGTRDEVTAVDGWIADGEPGIHRVLGEADSVLTAFAVNPPASESRLDRLTRRDIERRLESWQPQVVASAEAWPRAVFRQRLGREFWRPLLAVGLLLLLIEALVAATGRVAARRGPGRPPTAAAGTPAATGSAEG